MELNITGSKIVIADDSPTCINKLEILLNNQGYQVFKAFDGKQALDLVENIDPDLIILDLEMPYLNGVEICEKIRNEEKTNLTPIIILTASNSKDEKKNAISAGANEFLDKSFDTLELRLKVESLLKLKHAVDQLENSRNIIKSLAKAVEVKDKYTEGHAERVSYYAVKIGQVLNFEEKQLRDISMAGLLHDIGKIGIPDGILNKPDRLTSEEFDIIKKHPVIGEEICSPIKSFDKVTKIIRHHHEKLNGSGYPDGLLGDQINQQTRIMTIVDIYDALTSDRSYRCSMDVYTAFEILNDGVDKGELDDYIVNVFWNIIKHEK